jgi:hypothetical protein
MSDAISRASSKASRLLVAAPMHAIRLPDGDPLSLSLIALEHAIVKEVSSTSPLERKELVAVVSDAAGLMGVSDPAATGSTVVDAIMNTRRGFKPFAERRYLPGVGLSELSFSLLEERYTALGQLTIKASDEARSLLLSMLNVDDIDAEALIRLATELAVADGALDRAAELAVTLRLQCDSNLTSLRSRLESWRMGVSDDDGILTLIERAIARSADAPAQLKALVEKVSAIDSSDAIRFIQAMRDAQAAASRLRQFLWGVHNEAAQIIAERLCLVMVRSLPLYDVTAKIASNDIALVTLFHILRGTGSARLPSLEAMFDASLAATSANANERIGVAVDFRDVAAQSLDISQRGDALLAGLLDQDRASAGNVALVPEENAVLRHAISRLYYWLVSGNDQQIASDVGPYVSRSVYQGADINAKRKEDSEYARAA